MERGWQTECPFKKYKEGQKLGATIHIYIHIQTKERLITKVGNIWKMEESNFYKGKKDFYRILLLFIQLHVLETCMNPL